jgi:hypothetical protein
MRPVPFLVLVASTLVLAGPALAQGPVTTASPGASVAPPPTAAPPPLPISGPSSAEGPPVAIGPCGPEKVKPDGRLDTAPHGEVDASIGTRGYRQIGGAVCQPIGQDGFVAVSASQTQGQTYRGR